MVIGLLSDYQGAVQTDGYEAYSIYEHKKGVLLLGCWAHAIRVYAAHQDRSMNAQIERDLKKTYMHRSANVT